MPLRRIVTRGFQNYWRMTRGLRLGTQACVVDARDRVLLVRYSENSGWELPGGCVARDEAAEQALRRHLRELCGIDADGRPLLFAIQQAPLCDMVDHVAVYAVRSWHQIADSGPKAAHFEQGFFAAGQFPVGVTSQTSTLVNDILERLAAPKTC